MHAYMHLCVHACTLLYSLAHPLILNVHTCINKHYWLHLTFQLGNQLGTEGIYHDEQEQEESVRYRYSSQLPNHVIWLDADRSDMSEQLRDILCDCALM